MTAQGGVLIELIYWTVEEHTPAVLRLTDSLVTRSKQLRVETPGEPPSSEPILTINDPWWEFRDGGISFTGRVARPRRLTDPEETWFARPIAEPDSDPVRWQVEIVELATGRTIDVIEEAKLEEKQFGANAAGDLIESDQLDFDVWWLAYKNDELEDRLSIRGAYGKMRWITDYDFHALLPYEATLKGKAKHRSEWVEVHVKLKPSGRGRAAKALGGVA